MGSEGGGEGGRRSGIAADGCDVRGGPSASWVCLCGAGVQPRRVEGLGLVGWEETTDDGDDDGGGGNDVPEACDDNSSDNAGSGTVCFGSESVGGGDG
jgi:hypothetical protein